MIKNRGMHGITKETNKHMILDAGVLIVNYGMGAANGERLLGATVGGSTFTLTRDIKIIEADGVKGKTKGLRRVINEDATLKVNLFEMTPENFALALAGSIVTEVPKTATKEKYTSIQSGDIQNISYVDNIALLATISGTEQPLVFILYNTLSDENFEIGNEDKSEAVLPVTFSAHWVLNYEENKVPWDIQFPDGESYEKDE